MSLVIDPRKEDPQEPAVVWDMEAADGQWAGTLISAGALRARPQVELRQELNYGGSVVVRLSIGDHIERQGKEPVPAGVMLSADRGGAISLDFSEWLSLQRAVSDGIDKLVEAQQGIWDALGDKFS